MQLDFYSEIFQLFVKLFFGQQREVQTDYFFQMKPETALSPQLVNQSKRWLFLNNSITQREDDERMAKIDVSSILNMNIINRYIGLPVEYFAF